VHHGGVTQPPEGQGEQPNPPLQPFGAPGPPPPGHGTPPPGYGNPPPGYGQPYGSAPGYGQPYGAYQPYPGSPGTAAPPGRDPALAEWWQRLLARLIDGIVIGVLISPFWLLTFLPMLHRLQSLGQSSPYSSPASQQAFNNAVSHTVTGMFGTLLLLGLAIAIITFGYDWLQHGLWGQTIGKRVLGTRVVTADTRSRISGGAACGRAAVYGLIPFVPTVGGIFALINELWLLWDPQRQCLHDKAARTVVVKANMVAAATAPAQQDSR
jgi:uncharacterized RDD family membrane protein YckC